MALFGGFGGRYERPLHLIPSRPGYSDYLGRNQRFSTKPGKPERIDPPAGSTPRIFFPARYEENGDTKFSYSLSAPAGSSSSEGSVLRDIKGRPITNRKPTAATAPPATYRKSSGGRTAVKWTSKSSTESRHIKSVLKKPKPKKSEPEISAIIREIHTGSRSPSAKCKFPWYRRGKSKCKVVTFSPDTKEKNGETFAVKVPSGMITYISPPGQSSPPKRTVDDILAEIKDQFNDIYKGQKFSTYTPVDPQAREYMASRLKAAKKKAAAIYKENEKERMKYAMGALKKCEQCSLCASLKFKTSTSNTVETKYMPNTSGLKKSGDSPSFNCKRGKYYNPKYANVKAKVSSTMSQAELMAHYCTCRQNRSKHNAGLKKAALGPSFHQSNLTSAAGPLGGTVCPNGNPSRPPTIWEILYGDIKEGLRQRQKVNSLMESTSTGQRRNLEICSPPRLIQVDSDDEPECLVYNKILKGL